MLDINFIRENKEIVLDVLKKRKASVNLGEILTLDKEKRRLTKEAEDLRQEKK